MTGIDRTTNNGERVDKRIFCLASLYEPLEFLADKIANFNQCDLSEASVRFVDVSSGPTWEKVERLIKAEAKFDYELTHFEQRKSLYWVWNWIIDDCFAKYKPQYFCNTNVDDLNHPDYFRKMSKYLDENRSIAILAAPWGVTRTKHQQWPAIAEDGNVIPDVTKTCGHFPMWRAKVHRRVGNFNQDMVCIGDADFWNRTKRYFGREAFAVHPEVLGCYLSHSNNLYTVSRGPNGQKGEVWDRKLMGRSK